MAKLEPLDERVLLLAPTARDAAASWELLARVGISCSQCPTVGDICREIDHGAGVVVVTAEAVLADGEGCLALHLKAQPRWSDLPVVVLTPPGQESPRLLRLLEEVGPITLMKRPVQMSAFVSTVRAALRDRRRQYEVRDLLLGRDAAEELRAERERYRVTLASIGDAVIATDTAGRVTFLNSVAGELIRWETGAALGKPLDEVFRILDERTRRPAANPALRALREGMVVELANHTVLIARDGTERPIDDSAAPMLDGSGTPVGAVMVFRDVTERRRVQEAQAQLAAIVESSDDAIVSKSLDGTIRSWNAGAERLFGYTSAEAVGQLITLIIPPERVDEEQDILARLRRGERVEQFETVRLTKSGQRVDISLTVSPIRDAYGAIVGASKVARDITEQKAAAAVLRDADRKKDEFIALLAHELRNPLAPIRNGLQVLRLSTERAVRERSQAMMDRQLAHMVRMIDDLLDVSRINQSKMELRRSRVPLAEVAASAVETARPAIDEAGHELTVSLPAAPVYLDADLTRLSQVFSNLLTNSAKYTPRGGQIWLSAIRAGGAVAVSVRDTGIGIPSEAQPHIFDMFSQVDRSVERTSGGLGIGLALVKGLVEMHGGTVTVASRVDHAGSTFTVTLPVVSERVEPSAEEPEPGKVSGPVRRILVVDDNRDGAESMADMLGILGNEVRTAHDGIKAVAVAEVFRPELILMDVGMPGLNGLDATRRIRDQPWGRAVTIIALTGWGQENDREHSREAGCDGHLVKPVHLQDLEKVLTKVGR